jgi:putative transposase
MKYNPDKQCRQSIRLKGYNYTLPGIYFITICAYQRECLFGNVVDGEMRLSDMGGVVRSHWLKLPTHHSNLQLNTFIIMPNHLHGIPELTNHTIGAVGAGLAVTPPSHPKPGVIKSGRKGLKDLKS